LGGVQAGIGQEVHVTPLGVSRWDEVFGAHPR